MKAFIILSVGIGLALAGPVDRDPIQLSSDWAVPLSYRKPIRIPTEDISSEMFADAPEISVRGNTDGPNFMREIPNSKIVGGAKASITEVPYQLRLMITAQNGSTYQCGASILNSKWALTAAHCFSGFRLKSVLVQAGYSDFSTPKEGGEYDLWGEQVIIHENWDSKTIDSDIAVLQVSGTFKTDTPSSKAVQLVDAGQRPTGDAVASGWGATLQGSPASDALMKVTLPVLPDLECEKTYVWNFNVNTMLCAGYTDGTKDTCQGDSGGPLVLNGVQIGVVSFGKGCAQPEFPGVYARVATFREWIDANTKL